MKLIDLPPSVTLKSFSVTVIVCDLLSFTATGILAVSLSCTVTFPDATVVFIFSSSPESVDSPGSVFSPGSVESLGSVSSVTPSSNSISSVMLSEIISAPSSLAAETEPIPTNNTKASIISRKFIRLKFKIFPPYRNFYYNLQYVIYILHF